MSPAFIKAIQDWAPVVNLFLLAIVTGLQAANIHLLMRHSARMHAENERRQEDLLAVTRLPNRTRKPGDPKRS
jgi:hypothetical protein